MLKGVEEVAAVLVALKNGLSFVAPGSDVVDGTCVFYGSGRAIVTENLREAGGALTTVKI